jgi:hypothetical protein
MDKKLSDDEIVKQFRGRSLGQKLENLQACANYTKQSHQSFILLKLVKTWIEDTAHAMRRITRPGLGVRTRRLESSSSPWGVYRG